MIFSALPRAKNARATVLVDSKTLLPASLGAGIWESSEGIHLAMPISGLESGGGWEEMANPV